MGIRFDREYLKEIVNLFEWSEAEDKELDVLSGTSNWQYMNDKRCRHIYYTCEMTYSLAMEPRRGISSNPGCKWQLVFLDRTIN